MVNILHISDIHLDRPFSTGEAHIALALREAGKTALTRSVDYSIKEKMDFLIISGDLFDSDTVSPDTAFFIWNEIKRLEDHGIKVLYTTGNHDSSGAMRALKYFKWPSNVYIFENEEWEKIELSSASGENVSFVGIGYTGRKIVENKIAGFPLKKDVSSKDGYVVGIAHTEVLSHSGAKSASSFYSYMPCTLEDIKALGYDYFALGHIHKRNIFNSVKAAYSGSFQALRINEVGRCGGIRISLSAGEALLETVDFSTVIFENIKVDIGGSNLVEDVMESCVKGISALSFERDYDADSLIVQCHLTGKTGIWNELISEEILRAIEEEVRLKTGALKIIVCSKDVRGYVYADDYADGDNILGYIINLIDSDEGRDDISKEIYGSLKERFGMGFGALDEEYVGKVLMDNRDYIAGLFIRGTDSK